MSPAARSRNRYGDKSDAATQTRNTHGTTSFLRLTRPQYKGEDARMNRRWPGAGLLIQPTIQAADHCTTCGVSSLVKVAAKRLGSSFGT